jgi:hypothetical protein
MEVYGQLHSVAFFCGNCPRKDPEKEGAALLNILLPMSVE